MATAKRNLTDPQVQGPAQADTGPGFSVDETVELNDQVHVIDLPEAIENGHGAGDGSENDLRAAAIELVEKTRRQQALPPKIEDPGAIARVVALLQPRL